MTRAKPLDELTRAHFIAYERVRKGGRWNMFDTQARLASGLDEATYLGVITHYSELRDLYPDVRS